MGNGFVDSTSVYTLPVYFTCAYHILMSKSWRKNIVSGSRKKKKNTLVCGLIETYLKHNG